MKVFFIGMKTKPDINCYNPVVMKRLRRYRMLDNSKRYFSISY